MAYLTREDILKADDLETREVDVPEWGGTVLVRALTGFQRDRYQASMLQFQKNGARGRPELENMTAKLVALAAVDEDGHTMFTELDVANLGKKSSVALDRVGNVAAELSGITDEALGEATENLEPTVSDDSGSSSPNG